jgi:hypothetical protein
MARFAWDSLRGPDSTPRYSMHVLLAMFQQRGRHSSILQAWSTFSRGLQKPGSGPEAWMQRSKPLMQRGLAGLTPSSP